MPVSHLGCGMRAIMSIQPHTTTAYTTNTVAPSHKPHTTLTQHTVSVTPSS